MKTRIRTLSKTLLGLSLILLPISCEGDDGKDGVPGPTVIDVSTESPDVLEGLDVVSEITRVTIASPPVVTFSLKTDTGIPIVGLVPFWEDDPRFVRFTACKLVPGQDGDPDSWVNYVRDGGEPDYDTGASLVDHRNGTYTFTFDTDVTNVPGVPYEPSLTHRVAGQIGAFRTVPLEEQNLWLDFVPTGAPVTHTRNIAVMESCNECHDNLVFHGRRFEVQYCVTCHNPDLAMGEGNFSFMIHRIHSGGTFTVLGGGASFDEVTYPQSTANCRKCHDESSPETPDADHWMNLPNISACDGCHDVFATGTHSGPALTTNEACTLCHVAGGAEPIPDNHILPNATPHNPELFPNQRDIAYEMVDVEVDGVTNDVTVRFRITSDGQALDLTNLPADLVDPGTMLAFRYPTFLFGWALPQDGVDEPADFNNLGQRGGQPLSVDLDEFMPIETVAPVGALTYDPVDGVMTATVTDAAHQFPVGATMRTVALQNYLQQDLDGDGTADESLHALSAWGTASGDETRRQVIDTNKCSRCHEWLEGHGGNRVLGFGSDAICLICHNPNQSSSGRTVTDPMGRGLDQDLQDAIDAGTLSAMVDPNDPLTYPEDAQNFRDLIHGIHSSGFRTRAFQHVRGPGRQGYYDWDHVTFPRGASTKSCDLCHMPGSYELPLDDDLLATTVRTTGQNDGLDPDNMSVEAAFTGVPNGSDWVNTPMASSCYFCHTGMAARAHMALNGALVSEPQVGGVQDNRDQLVASFEACAVCHGPGRIADVAVVHER